MSLVKRAAQIVEETVGGATAEVGGKQTAGQLLLGYDPKLQPGYLGRNAAPQVDNNLVNYVAPNGATGRVPRGSAQQTMDELNFPPLNLNELNFNFASTLNEQPSSLKISNTIESPKNEVDLLETEEAFGGLLNNPTIMGLEEGVEAAATPASLLQESSSVFGTRPAYKPPSGVSFRQSEPYDLGRLDTLPPVEQDDLIKAQTEFARQNIVAREANREASREALERVRGLEAAALSDGSISGLLSRRAEIERGAMQIREGMSAQDARAMNRLSNGTDYARPFTDLEQAEMFEINAAIGRIGPVGDESFFTRLADYDNYSESVHRNANLSTTTENLTEGASSGNFVPGTLAFNETSSANSLLGMGDAAGLGGIGASMGLGAVLGGATSYATGGEFSEGAIMGGLAGGGINIGARAIRANQSGIESFLQRKVLGNAMTDERLVNAQAVSDIAKNPEAMSNLGFMQRAAASRLTTDPNKSAGLQSRHMVVGGSMLAGVAFTGRRNDKRRGFNAHRGNRI